MLHPVLLDRLNQALRLQPARPLTRRDARLSDVPGKVHAVIGMRRSGKSTFLQQLLAERRRDLPVEQTFFLSFDDDRLADLQVDQLSYLLEEYFRRFPSWRGNETVVWFLDEIQLVSGWEKFARRVLDTEKIELVVSGSSARMLSREIHTSLRGRALATEIAPFSFREFLRHRGHEPENGPAFWTSSQRSAVEGAFRDYLIAGGFPETQGLTKGLRIELLQSYVDAVLFRDVVERYGITKVAALRWLVRYCLRNPAGAVSVNRLAQDLKSQGLGIGKDQVAELLGHLVDAFLLEKVPIATDSERRRNTNPHKIYAADPGLIGAFDVSGRANTGHALETVAFHELRRRKADVTYVKTTQEGFEVDFLARYREGGEELIQVCADISATGTFERELRALSAAGLEFPRAKKRLLVLEREATFEPKIPGVEIKAVYEWLLEDSTPEPQ